MVSLIIMGCIVMSYFFMITTTIIKGISALLETMFDMLEVWAILLLGGIGIGVIELIVAVFGGSFWTIFWTIVGIVVVCALLGSIISLIGSIFLFVFELAMQLASLIYALIETLLEQIGDWSEMGLKYFLGTINKNIALS